MEKVGKEGRTILFVSHNMGAIQQLTNLTILLEDGKQIRYGTTTEVIKAYLDKDVDSGFNSSLKTKIEDFKIKSIGFNYDFLESGFNKPLCFDFNLLVESNKSEITFGLAILNSVGSKLLTSLCRIDELPAGEHNFSLILKDHHLPPGNYSINLGIDIKKNSILYQENILRFELSDIGVEDSFLTQRRDKIGAFIPGDWQLR
jgi:lipopolysaccharide transport system ATP-binding protein